MEKEVYFFYDESSHSRKITANTMNNDEFKNDFVSVIVGIEKKDYSSFEQDYLDFETKWKKRFTVDELKSTIVRNKKYRSGLASFKKDDLDLYNDLFTIIISHKAYLHFGIFNKIEYVVNQMLCKSNLQYTINFEGVSYSMSKALCVYHPKEVLASIEKNINEFLPKFKAFLNKRRKLNARIHGESEENAFNQMIYILDSINEDLSLEWNYVFSFDGFKKYIEELKLNNSSFLIDKEGNGATKQAAINDGVQNAEEEDSKKSCGIRCADLLAGFVSNFINSVWLATSYGENDATRDESLLRVEWFQLINKEAFNLYKLAYKVFYELNNSWHKFYCSTYRDSVVLFIALLKHFEEYKTYDDFRKDTDDYHQHQVNSILYSDLKKYLEKIDNNEYKIEKIECNEKDYYYNQKGAKCYFDYEKHQMLNMPSSGEKVKLFVLSVGFFVKKEKIPQPCITISEEGQPKCYLLPNCFNEWVKENCIMAIIHQNMFPCFLTIINNNNELSLKLSDI